MMNIICWSIQGCNLPRKENIVRDLRRDNKPNILFVKETKFKQHKIYKIAKKI